MPSKKPVRSLAGKKTVPWRVKPRELSRQAHLRQVRTNFWNVPISKLAGVALEISKRGVDQLTDAEKTDFLVRNAGVVSKAVSEGGGLRAQRTLSVVRGKLSQFSPKAVSIMVKDTVRYILRQEWAQISGATKSHLLQYLKARHIPVKSTADRDAFSVAFSDYFRNYPAGHLPISIDLLRFEQEYLEMRRDFKGLDQSNAEEHNEMYLELFGRKKLTPNQRRAALKWIRQNFADYKEERNAIGRQFKHLFMTEWDAYLEKVKPLWKAADDQFRERARKEVLSQFRQQPKTGARLETGSAVIRKSGTRQERIAAHELEEKPPSARVSDIRRRTITARTVGESFNVTAYVLAEIAKENRPTADTLTRLLEWKHLSPNSLVSLFTAGSLTQRVFIHTLADPDFQSQFGTNSINLVAKGLAFIGPTGKLIGRAQRAFQGPRGKQLFDFLEKKGILDTQHGEGKVVYLTRFSK